MSDGLNLFPARVPIGRVQLPNGPDGRSGGEVAVLGTAEFIRALVKLFERVGGPNGMSNEDLALLASLSSAGTGSSASDLRSIEQVQSAANPAGELSELRKAVEELRATGESCRAEVAALKKSLASVEIEASYRDRFRVNWERPGTIGSLTPNTGSFTRVKLGAGTLAAPSLTWGAEAATGWYRVAANSLGLSVSGTKRIGVDNLGLNVTGIVDVAGSFVRAGSATPGGGGQYRMNDDSGAQRWLAGLLGTVGERTYSIYDIATGNAWVQVAISGIVTLPGALVVSSGANITGAFQVFGASTFNGSAVITGSCGVSSAFGCNGKPVQTAASPGATATDLPTAIARVNQLAAVLSANGICT